MLDSYIQRLRTGLDDPWQSAIELLLIGAVVYAVLRFLQGTRGARLMQAVLLILTGFLVVAIVARFLQLDRIIFLYPYFVGSVFLVALVVFQPELRRGLMRIGETIGRRSRTAETARLIEPVVRAAASLSKRKIGALVAIEGRIPTGALAETGVEIDAEVSQELLETIFWPGSALHDLGVIIRHGRIAAAGCEFPLAETSAAERVLGSRHRAALGMSLETDALIVVVSEETGKISIARQGRLLQALSQDELRNILSAELLERAPAVVEQLADEQQKQTDGSAPSDAAVTDGNETAATEGDDAGAAPGQPAEALPAEPPVETKVHH